MHQLRMYLQPLLWIQIHTRTHRDAYVRIPFHALFHDGMLQDTEPSSLRSAVGGLSSVSFIYRSWQRGAVYGTLRLRRGPEPSTLWIRSFNPRSPGQASHLLLRTWVHDAGSASWSEAAAGSQEMTRRKRPCTQRLGLSSLSLTSLDLGEPQKPSCSGAGAATSGVFP